MERICGEKMRKEEDQEHLGLELLTFRYREKGPALFLSCKFVFCTHFIAHDLT